MAASALYTRDSSPIVSNLALAVRTAVGEEIGDSLEDGVDEAVAEQIIYMTRDLLTLIPLEEHESGLELSDLPTNGESCGFGGVVIGSLHFKEDLPDDWIVGFNH